MRLSYLLTYLGACMFIVCSTQEIQQTDGIAQEDFIDKVSYNPEVNCGKITDWEACNKQSECNYLNSHCGQYINIGIRYQRWIPYEEYMYCRNASDYESIDLSRKLDQTLVIGHSEVATPEFHPLCEWNIATDLTYTVTVEITRDCNNYEDIYLEATTNRGWVYFDSKSLTDCDSDSVVLYFQNTTFVKIRSKILNINSAISISISQVPITTTPFRAAPLLFLILAISGFFFFFTITFCCAFCHNYGRRAVVKHSKLTKRYGKTRRIEKAMKLMRTGTYNKLLLKYPEVQCPICLDPYTVSSHIHVINGCGHSFHSVCLRRCFLKIKKNLPLKCPSCNRKVNESNEVSNSIDRSSFNDNTIGNHSLETGD